MQIRVELDDTLITAIDRAANIQKISRTAAFQQALESWVVHQPKAERSLDVSKWDFDPDFIGFEVHRPGPEAMPEFRRKV